MRRTRLRRAMGRPWRPPWMGLRPAHAALLSNVGARCLSGTCSHQSAESVTPASSCACPGGVGAGPGAAIGCGGMTGIASSNGRRWAGLALREAGRELQHSRRGGAGRRATCFRARRARAAGLAPGVWRARSRGGARVTGGLTEPWLPLPFREAGAQAERAPRARQGLGGRPEARRPALLIPGPLSLSCPARPGTLAKRCAAPGPCECLREPALPGPMLAPVRGGRGRGAGVTVLGALRDSAAPWGRALLSLNPAAPWGRALPSPNSGILGAGRCLHLIPQTLGAGCCRLLVPQTREAGRCPSLISEFFAA